jgi:hypothetical protein
VIAGTATFQSLIEANVKAMLRDYVDTEKLSVGLVVRIVDEHAPRVASYGKLDNGTDRDVDGDPRLSRWVSIRIRIGKLLIGSW